MPRGVSFRQDRHPSQSAPFRLALAELVQPRATDRAAERHQDRLHRHFDNSANNPEAADPTKEVTWGDQSWDEMMIGFFNLVFDADLPVDKLFVKKPKAEIAGRSRRIIALAEPGETIHQPFADAAMRWLQETAATEGFTVDYIRTTDPIDEAYLAAHDLFVQVNYPPYWTPVAEAAFKKAMEQGTIGWVGFHPRCSASSTSSRCLPSSINSWATSCSRATFVTSRPGRFTSNPAHPVVKGLPAAFTIENDVGTYDRSPRPDVRARKRR